MGILCYDPAMPAPRLIDIAKQAGCSKATVSLALRNDPRVNVETRRQVREIADLLGYRPNPVLSQIASERWRRGKEGISEVVAYVTFRMYATPRIVATEGHPAKGMAEEAERLGFRLEVFPWYDFESLDRIATIIRNRGIRGVILGATSRPDQRGQVEAFPYDRFSVVACELGFHRLPVILVSQDHYSAARRLVAAAHAGGANRIGAILESKGFSPNDAMIEAGYVYEQWRIAPGRRPMVLRASLGAGEESETMNWIRRQKLEAVVTRIPNTAHRIREEFPDLPLFCLHTRPELDWLPGTLLPGEQTGQVAMATLAGQLSRHHFGSSRNPETISVPFDWHAAGARKAIPSLDPS